MEAITLHPWIYVTLHRPQDPTGDTREKWYDSYLILRIELVVYACP